MGEQSVVISGIGLVTPIGNNRLTSWQSICSGVSGIGLQQGSCFGQYPCRQMGLVREDQEHLDNVFDTKNQRRTDRFIHLAMLAGHEAMFDAGLNQALPINRDRFGVYIGVGIGGIATIEDSTRLLDRDGMKRVSPFLIPRAINNLSAGWLAMKWDLRGPSTAITNACSSGADAIGLAFRLIRDGYADYMLAGGTESCLTPLVIAAFDNMHTLSMWQGEASCASRPFDRDRSGFVIAEGSGIVVLERKDLAIKRGAPIYAELVGYGASSDAHHITAMHPDGRGACMAMHAALNDARVNPAQIGYINAHGTGTKMNDCIEVKAVHTIFGNHADPKQPNHLAMSSTKSMTGHALGAAGGIEVALTALALKHQILPPTINCDNQDAACEIDVVAHTARKQSFNHAMSSSFGFGGGNAALVLKRFS